MFQLIVFYLLLLIRHVIGSGCLYGNEGGFVTAECSGFLSEVPQDLTKSIEALYLSPNRIRSLHNDDFSHYTSLKYLFLNDNRIAKIEPDTFASLTNLKELDLSNANINFSTLHLPKSLERLHLNERVNDLDLTEIPLNYLEKLSFLSMGDSFFKRLPFFGGAFPSLTVLNFTKNPLEYLNIEEFAHLCKLNKLFITPIKKLNDPCDCERFKKWTTDYGITVTPSLFCIPPKNMKCDLQPSKKAMENYDVCIQDARKKNVYQWAFIGGCIVIGVFLCIILYLCCTRRKSCCKICCCKKNKMININA